MLLSESRLGDVPSLREIAIWADTGRGLPQASVLKEHPQLDPGWYLWRVLGGGWCDVLVFREVVDCPRDGGWGCGEWRELSVRDSRSGVVVSGASSSTWCAAHGGCSGKV